MNKGGLNEDGHEKDVGGGSNRARVTAVRGGNMHNHRNRTILLVLAVLLSLAVALLILGAGDLQAEPTAIIFFLLIVLWNLVPIWMSYGVMRATISNSISLPLAVGCVGYAVFGIGITFYELLDMRFNLWDVRQSSTHSLIVLFLPLISMFVGAVGFLVGFLTGWLYNWLKRQQPFE